MHRATRVACALALTVLMVSAAGCGGGDDAEPSIAGPSIAEPSIVGALRLVPDVPGARTMISVTVYDKAWPAAGADRHATGKAATKALDALTNPSVGAGVIPSVFFLMPDPYGRRAAVGYNPLLLASDITVGSPSRYVVATGEFDTDKVKQALTTALSKAHVRTIDGTSVVRWLPDNAVNPKAETRLFANIYSGQVSGRVAVREHELAFARTDAAIKQLVQVANGDERTLDDVDPLDDVATTLDDAGVYSARLRMLNKGDRTDFTKLHVPAPQAVGQGVGEQDGKPVLVLALAMVDEDAGDRLATKLRQRIHAPGKGWSDDAQGATVEVHDNVIVATLPGQDATRMWSQVWWLTFLIG